MKQYILYLNLPDSYCQIFLPTENNRKYELELSAQLPIPACKLELELLDGHWWLTEADLIYFDVRPIIKELPNSIEFLRVYVKKLEESYAQMWEVREIMRESAQARYAWFQRTYPKLQNIMQLKDVATFLGITPVTLSRIRARETISAEKDDAT